MDANQKAITNGGNIVLDWSGAFYGNGTGISNITGISFSGNANQFNQNGALENQIKSGSLQSNNVFWSTTSAIQFKDASGVVRQVLGSGGAVAFPQGMSGAELVATNGAGSAMVDITGVDGNIQMKTAVIQTPSSTANSLLLGWVSPGTVTTNVGTGLGIYSTNEAHTLQFIGTNAFFVSGAGTANANGIYSLKNTVGGITVWTNANGLTGFALDGSLHSFLDEQNITNSSGTLLYSAIGSTPLPATSWSVQGGTGPAPTVVVGTNTFTTNITAYYPLQNIGVGQVLNTNYYFVNPVTGNDTNAVPGVRDRPYKNFTNVVWNYAVHTNDVIFLESGTNYFGFSNIQVSNQVSIIGLGPRDSCWLAKDASLVDNTDISLKPGIGSTFENFSGNITFSFGTANVTLRNVHTIGVIDNFLPQSASNYLADGCIFDVNTPDGSNGTLADAGVVGGSGSGIIKNCVFISKRRGNGNMTRRPLVIKGGTNIIIGTAFIGTDSTNNAANAFGCTGLSIEGSGFTMVSGCAALSYNTNANNFCAFTNANVLGGEVIYGSTPFSLLYTNGSVLWSSLHTIKVDGTISAAGMTNTGLTASRIVVSDANKGLASATASSATTAVAGDGSPIVFGAGLTLSSGTLSSASGSQTPWSTDVDGAQFRLTNAFSVTASNIVVSNATPSRIAQISSANTVTNATAANSATTLVAGDGSGVTAGAGITISGGSISSGGADSTAWHNTGDNYTGSFILGPTNGQDWQWRMQINGAAGATIGSFRTIANNDSLSWQVGTSNTLNGTAFNGLIFGYHNSVGPLTDPTIMGGAFNQIGGNGNQGFIAGGRSNVVNGNYAFAAGQAATAANDNSFVWNGIPNKVLTTSGGGGDNGKVLFGTSNAGFWVTNGNDASINGVFATFGSSIWSSNTAAIRNGTFVITNSGNLSLFYMGTNPPAAGHENKITSGVIASNKIFVVDAPTQPDALVVLSNGPVRVGSLSASKVVLTDANTNFVPAAASGAVPIDADGTASTAAQVNTLFPGNILTNGTSFATTFSNNVTVDATHKSIAAHISGQLGPTPTVTTNVACGPGSVATLDANARDSGFNCKLVTGSTPAVGQIFHFTFGTAYANAPHVVWSHNSLAAGLLGGRVYTTNQTTTGFDFFSASTPMTASTNYEWQFIIIE